MSSTSYFRFVPVRLKKHTKKVRNDTVDVRAAPKNLVLDMDQKRSAVMSQLDEFRSLQKSGHRSMDGLCATAEGRQKLADSVVDNAIRYVGALFTLVEAHPSFSKAYVYLWEDSTADQKVTGVDDFRYDACAILFNAGALLMDVAEYLLVYKSTVGYLDGIQKEAYHLLLTAAGVFKQFEAVAEAMQSSPIRTPAPPIPLEATPPFARFMEAFALAQAQEIGTWKAALDEANKDRDTPAQLCRRTSEMYDRVTSVCRFELIAKDKDYTLFCNVAKLKSEVYTSLTFTFAASGCFKTRPSDALWFLAKGDENIAIIIKIRDKSKHKLPFNTNDFLDYAWAIIRRNSERITKINTMVTRAKPAIGPVNLPASQELARAKEVKLPVSIPAVTPPAPSNPDPSPPPPPAPESKP